MRSRKPHFITVEGVEGVGKSTNIEFIEDFLARKNVEVFVTREPGGTPMAEEIRRLLLSPREEEVDPVAELLLIFAARAQHLNQAIEKQLQAGVWVLCDRFTDATFAYQGYGRGLPLEVIDELEQLVQKGRRPTRTLYLDLPVEEGLERARLRGGTDRFERESIEFFHKVREGYLRRVARDPERFRVIDASKPLAQVQKDIAADLQKLIDEGA